MSSNQPPFQELFDRQSAYFATDVTKSYEWRVDQLDRLLRMLKENRERFSEASKRDFKPRCRNRSSKSLRPSDPSKPSGRISPIG